MMNMQAGGATAKFYMAYADIYDLVAPGGGDDA